MTQEVDHLTSKCKVLRSTSILPQIREINNAYYPTKFGVICYIAINRSPLIQHTGADPKYQEVNVPRISLKSVIECVG
jgi:hypothetical protein